MTAQKKGPAEAPTSPSRGSNVPEKEKAVNSTRYTSPDVESHVLSARIQARCADHLVEFVTENGSGAPNGAVVLQAEQIETLRFAVGETRRAVEQLSDAFCGGKSN